jgi:hypothetical protein
MKCEERSCFSFPRKIMVSSRSRTGREIVGEFFFHGRTVIGETVRNRDEVEFWLDDSRRGGWEAVDVKRIQFEEPVYQKA